MSVTFTAPAARALVVGLGRSGRAAALLLRALGVQVHAYDANPDCEAPAECSLFVDEHTIPSAAFSRVSLVVLSPGVPPEMPRARAAECAPRAKIVGELGLALELLHAAKQLPRLCLVTGTNGKSTITALIGHLLESAGRKVFTGGNLGVPLCELVLQIHQGLPVPDFAVLECSSYQLETLPVLPTEVAILSNLSPDHLARYRDLEHYAQTKTAVFAGLGESGLALLDGEDTWTSKLEPASGKVENLLSPGAPQLVDDSLCLPSGLSFARSDLRCAGRHNAKNALFALRAGEALGLNEQELGKGLRSYEGLPHRMAFVREHAGIAYYNDSKATNVASTLAGITGFERPFVLLAGGQLKGESLEPLMQVVLAEGRGMIAFGEGAATLVETARGRFAVEQADDLKQAFALAQAMAQVGDAIVLSPAGASWDAYANFAKRGEHFEGLVGEL